MPIADSIQRLVRRCPRWQRLPGRNNFSKAESDIVRYSIYGGEMPKIEWSNLPPALRDHLFERLRERKIRVEDLYQLKLWRETEPEAPDGLWYKDFGSFKICGEGRYPKTFLLRGQPARGTRL